jgi:transposase
MKAIIAVDISKAFLDIYDLKSGISSRIANGAAGLSAWFKELSGHAEAIVVVEATGIYSRRLMAGLHAAGISVRCVQPRRVRQFAQASGCLAKTDKLDARMIAQFAVACPDAPSVAATPEIQRLKTLLSRRRQLVEDRKREQCRLSGCDEIDMQQDIGRHCLYLKESLSAIERLIKAALQKSPMVRALYNLMVSMPGIGFATACTLLADLPELGKASREQIAALAGLAPYNRDSGTRKGKRSIHGGRKYVRCALYMAAVTAIKYDNPFRASYRRLTTAGKPFKLAITAVMRKMIVALNSMLKNNMLYTA